VFSFTYQKSQRTDDNIPRLKHMAYYNVIVCNSACPAIKLRIHVYKFKNWSHYFQYPIVRVSDIFVLVSDIETKIWKVCEVVENLIEFHKLNLLLEHSTLLLSLLKNVHIELLQPFRHGQSWPTFCNLAIWKPSFFLDIYMDVHCDRHDRLS